MDPQKLSQLDPKLREAYQRVMGTPIPEPEPTPTPTSTIQEPPTAPQTESSMPQPKSVPTPEAPMPQQPPAQAANFVQMNSEVAATPSSTNFATPAPQAQTITLKKKNGIMVPILFGIAGLIFIAVYTLFWTELFGLKVPFLP